MTLPPGQRALDHFPRFGTHMGRRAPAVPADFALEVTGAVREPMRVSPAQLAALPHVERVADFHCVAGWSATGLRWQGVPFADFYRTVVQPCLRPDTTVTHLGFRGLDGYRSVVTIADALAEDVLLADRLDGRPLGADHGAPLRLVSPSQYGFVSTKHLCAVEVHTAAPVQRYERAPAFVRYGLRLATPHPRARVWCEERHHRLPAWAVRRLYRTLIKPIEARCRRGGEHAEVS